MKKVAICLNSEDNLYTAYYYSWFFKIFGPNIFSYITTTYDNDEYFIEKIKKKVNKTIKIIKIIKIYDLKGEK